MQDVNAPETTEPVPSADRTWGQLFPQLHTTLVLDGRSIVDEPAIGSDVQDLILDCITREIVEHRTAETLRTLLPYTPRHFSDKRLSVGSRGFTCLNRLTDDRTLDGVLARTTREILDVRGVGLGTVNDIVGGLVRLSMLADHSPEPSDALTDRQRELPPAVQQLIDDVTALSRWRRIRNHTEMPLFEIHGDDAAPEQLQEILIRLETLTAQDFPGDPQPSAAESLALFYDGLDDRDKHIFRDRIVAPEPATLQAVADSWGVSRERIRQLETKLLLRVEEFQEFGTPVGDLLASLRAEITPVASLNRLLEVHPELRETLPGVSLLLWQVLDGLDDHIKITDGWAATPDTDVAKANTRQFLAAFADAHGVVDSKSLPTNSLGTDTERHSWLQWCGYEFYRGRILTTTKNLGDHAAAILAVHGEPMAVDDIFASIGKNRSLRSFLNQLGGDPRFTRTTKSDWGLAEWEVEEYGSIRAQIARVLDENDGSMLVDELVEEIATRFGVSPSSVRTYSVSGDFMVEKGIVTRRTIAAAPRKTPEDTRGFYRDGDVWRYSISTNKDHIRGSGFAVPSGVARLFEVEYGSSIELRSRLGAQSLRWKGVQPGCGSIRRFVEDIRAVEGDRLFLEFRDDSTFDVIVAPTKRDDVSALAQALTLTGRADSDRLSDAELVSAMAEALGVPGEDRPRRILSAARARDEESIISLLEQAWVTPPA